MLILHITNKMNNMKDIQNDEINLIELLEVFWNSKFLISIFVLLGTLIGYCYTLFIQPRYDVFTSYKMNSYSVITQQRCRSKMQCMEAEAKKQLLYLLKDGWSPNLSLSTSTPKNIKEYEGQLERARISFNNQILLEARNEIELILTELPDTMKNTNSISQHMLNAARVVQFIDSGQSAITFGPVSVVKTKITKILAWSSVLSGIIGVFIVLVRHNIKNRKEKMTAR